MNTVIYLLLPFVICTLALEVRPKICVNCKYFTPRFGKSNDFAKCSRFLKGEIDTSYLVTGEKRNSDTDTENMYYCSTARGSNSMCGIDGKFYYEK